LLSARTPLTHRARLCEAHQLADAVRLADGSTARLCQRCHRLHALSAFSGTKHACTQALAALAVANSRRRAARAPPSPQQAAEKLAASPDGSDSTAAQGPGRGSAHACDDVVAWLNDAVSPAVAPVPAALPEGTAFVARLSSSTPGANLATAAAALALHGFAIQIKLPHCASPAELPPAAALRGALGAALPDAVAPPSVALLPGCVLLLLDALLPAPAYADATSEAQAAARLAAALRGAGLLEHAGARGATVTVGGARCLVATLQVETRPPDDAPPFWLAPQAVLTPSGGGADDTAALLCDMTGGAQLAARCGGHHVRVTPQDGRLRVHLGDAAAAGPFGGALLVQCASAARSDTSRVVLLCGADAALAAEVNAACASLGLHDPGHDRGGATDAAMQHVLRILGDALRPRAPLRVRQAAGAAAVWLGWAAAASALVRVVQSEHDGAGPTGDECDAVTALVLHMATHASAARMAGHARAAEAAMEALATAPGAPQPHVAEAAWRLAGAALRRASDEGHADPGCAVAVARGDVDSADAAPECKAHARRVLLGVWRLILEHEAARGPVAGLEEVEDHDTAPLEVDVEEEERAYDEFMMVQNRFVWQTTSGLGVLGALMYVVQGVRHVAGRSDWPSTNEMKLAMPLIDRIVLRRPTWSAPSAAIRPRDVPWPAVRFATAVHFAYSVLFILPGMLVLFVLSWRRAPARWRHASTHFVLLSIPETFVAPLCDALVFHACGCVPEYPTAVPVLVRAVAVIMCVQRCMARPGVMYAVFANRALCTFGALLAIGHWRVLFTNFGYAFHAASLAYLAATVGARERAMRAAFARHRAARLKKAD
jgi:hypothetical protein